MRDDYVLLDAARRASEVLEEFEAKKRMEAGYTRIDAEQIAGAADVVVMYRKFERLLGGFLEEDGIPGIIVNWDRPRGLVHMTCAHELGHFSLGHASTSDITVDIPKEANLVERAANQFAYALLAPSWLVVQTMRRHRWARSHLRIPAIVYQMSLRLGMSYKAMVWSLNRLGHLSVSESLEIVDTQPIGLKHDVLGTAPNNSRSDVWLLTDADRGRILEPGLGDQMVFDLPNHAGSGHLWTIDEARSEGFMLKPFVRDACIAPQPRAADIVVGGAGSTLRYELTTPPVSPTAGESDPDGTVQSLDSKQRAISLTERTPWDSERDAIGQFSLFAEFERLGNGLPQAERDRRLTRTRQAR
ncbi:Zn-dependent peptidase ImmA (M78 family) [Comamonas sp. BIGb0124]|uniref:ImmA/IrrE family metallo-endopeptidase n=1 Tax=Comamonas sp. BIGb0124 TaxID=2485130 RepID=UPI000F49390D|nr:ImmA/IrrE family metallo-endopeptidase [Comamonas sp. BIGb0124]ROR21403.1 Zn-dependent peptidase ImmA (M78 family) [Comamonas sp. BIGb0124]